MFLNTVIVIRGCFEICFETGEAAKNLFVTQSYFGVPKLLQQIVPIFLKKRKEGLGNQCKWVTTSFLKY